MLKYKFSYSSTVFYELVTFCSWRIFMDTLYCWRFYVQSFSSA